MRKLVLVFLLMAATGLFATDSFAKPTKEQDQGCRLDLRDNSRLENYIWELVGSVAKCTSQKERRVGGESYYYVAEVSCQLKGKTSDFSGLVDFDKKLYAKGHPGQSAVLENSVLRITGGNSTQECDKYFRRDTKSKVDKLCREAISAENATRVMADVLGVVPECKAAASHPVSVDRDNYYYVGNVSCVIKKKPGLAFKNDISVFGAEMKKLGFSGYSITEGTEEFRISAQTSTGRCSTFAELRPVSPIAKPENPAAAPIK